MPEEEDDEGGGASLESFAELDALLAEPTVGALPVSRRATLGAQDTLTAQPAEDDDLLFAVPVCAPYAVMSSYKYKLKLTPGSQKKGKAAKQAVGILSASASGRERELMRAVTDDELVRIMLANVKVGVSSKVLQMQKSALKHEQKEKATQRRQEEKAAKEEGKEAAN